MRPHSLVLTTIALITLLAGPAGARAQGGAPSAPASVPIGTSFTYQGQLKSGGAPITASCTMAFRLYDDPAAGALVGNPITTTVPVTAGLFTVGLDFGAGAFTGDARWLDIRVKCGLDPAFTPLAPRQPLTAAPYALALPGLYTLPGVSSPNIVGGYNGNSVGPSTDGATIAGGGFPGSNNTIGAGASYAAIGGGAHNVITATYATIGGGTTNTAGGDGDTIGGGTQNTASGHSATAAGGDTNHATGDFATVGGGEFNTASAFGAVVAGGGGFNGIYFYTNTASADWSAIGGGGGNTASEWYTTVGGGQGNTASGLYATVPGGLLNYAVGAHSFAAGTQAKAKDYGAFVWSDFAAFADFNSSGSNQFDVRATGGISLVTAINGNGSPTAGLFVSPAGAATVNGLQVGISGTVVSNVQASQATLGSNGTASAVFTVTFPSAFSALPKVIVSTENDPGFDVGDTFVATVRKVTTTNFVVNVVRVDLSAGWAQQLRLNWYAWQ